jgi:integrase/recombinase XerD
LAEVLLGTGARISEVLRLRRHDVDFERKEARTIGKGNKERVLFFTDRSLVWLGRYLGRREDELEALFATADGKVPKPLVYEGMKRTFGEIARAAGINKRVSAHILRHTMATTLLFNGCPIGHIKELLGHERLDTTCRYYLGLDRRAAKEAHQKFLKFE